MPTIRNTAGYDLEVSGAVYPSGEPVEVTDAQAAYLTTNPNFAVEPDGETERPKAGKKA